MDEAKLAVKRALNLIATEVKTAVIDLRGGTWGSMLDKGATGYRVCFFVLDEHKVTARMSDEGTSLIIEDDGRAQRFVYSKEKGALVREDGPGDVLSDPAGLVHELIYAKVPR